MATTLDNFIHEVMEEMIDLDTRSFYLANLLTDLSSRMRGAESMDIGEFSALTVSDAVNTSASARSHNTLTVQDIDDVANTLVKDQARGLSGELRRWKKHFQGGGRGDYVAKVARKVQATMRNDKDDRHARYLAYRAAQYVGAGSASAVTTHTNVNGAATTLVMVRGMIARMLNEQGVSLSDLAWVMNPWGSATVATLPEFKNMDNPRTDLGLIRVGTLDGVPVYMTQSVPHTRSATISASSISSNVLSLTFSDPHGFPVGQEITTSGLTTNVTTAAAVATVPSLTTLTVPLTSADAADNGTSGTATEGNPTAWNMLVNLERLYQAEEDAMVRVIPYGRERTSDVIQAEMDFGTKGREVSTQIGDPGTIQILHTDYGSITTA